MSENFCSKECADFIHAISNQSLEVEELLELMSVNLAKVADELFIGKIDATLAAPATAFEPNAFEDTKTLFVSVNGFDENVLYDMHYTTGENGKASIAIYPIPGHIITDTDRRNYSFISDIIFSHSAKSRLITLIKRASTIDTQTGIYNTIGFVQHGVMLYKVGVLSNYSALFMNIRKFKYTNSTLGTKMGDKILRLIARKIKSFIGKDGEVGRLGGDNFIAIITNARFNDLVSLITNFTVDDEILHNYEINFRVGAYHIQPGDTMQTVMNNVSTTFSSARKIESANVTFFTPTLLENVTRENEISVTFPSALQNNELVTYYQPKIQLKNNTLCGCEALSRWIKNDRVIPPMQFIPVLEREGSVCKLDFHVLNNICRDIRRWCSMGIEPVRISTNFSKMHMHNQRLADEILAIVDAYKIDYKYLEIELTEMTGYEDYEALSDFVNTMKSHGVHTSIDDFGTGYSSLNLLKDLNVDVIKLDKSFFTHIPAPSPNNNIDEILVKHIINMINELKMTVVAEGVETTSQAKFLRDINCSIAQGFLFDKPLPQEIFTERLAGNRNYV